MDQPQQTASVEPPPAVTASKKDMRRIAIASSTGTVIEYYDFLIYGTASALVFPHVFFPALGPAAGTVAAFATQGVAFLGRPLGAILFGHFGDRVGRKKTLITTLFLMGLSTVLIGLMPTAGQIGIAAPLLVLLLRILQGLAVGGEWAGATLLAAESAPKAKRGFYSMFGSLGGAVAVVLANLTFLIAGLTMSNDDFISYGWRIPFVASVVLIAVGLVVRLKIEESPVFRRETSRSGTSSAPLAEAFRNQPRQMLFGSGVLVMVFAFFYLSGSFLASYGTAHLHLAKTTVLSIGVLAGVVWCISMILGAVLSDRFGRRRVILVSTFVSVAWALALFPVLDIGTAFSYGVGVCLTLVFAGLVFGPVSAFMPELFITRYRYTAAGFCYNVAGILGGAVPPLVAAPIIGAAGSLALGGFLAVLAMISAVCTLGLKETRHYEMDRGELVAG
ncbi:MFS transporter [Amycolatopsis sp. A1MSW2902]|uniref:MFS transporter n=1 Tax=Amycolatopsis sp. A1MSW2902 TaxID=687413 RepID=UPI00307E4FA1